MNSISNQTREQGRRAFKGFAIVLSFVVYAAALAYAGVRSYDLFARTLPADMLPLALLGILALEVTAVGLPLAIHFWTEPGSQRYTAYAFYALDLALIVGNSILDAAANAGTILPEFMQAYGTFAVPGLPVICMLGWSLIWLLDPSTQEHDMVAGVRAATRRVMLEKIVAAVDEVDITRTVQESARAVARATVADTVGEVETRNTKRKRAQAEPAELPTLPAPIEPSHETVREVAAPASPKAASKNGNGSH